MLKVDLNQLFEQSPFTLETTNDGSPTLRVNSSQESMHHFDGAASETWYVYGSVLEQALKLLQPTSLNLFKIASIGLGLGYVELTWALLLSQFQPENANSTWTFDSYEISNLLRNQFIQWFTKPLIDASPVYDLALTCLQAVRQQPQMEVSQVKSNLKLPSYQFHGDILADSTGAKWNFICFDAFSKNTDAGLWTEEYLDYFLNRFAAADCVFTTYAATSVLKKVLTHNHFKLIKRLGYSGKRECTLAVRGKFTDGFATFQTF